MHRRGTSGSAPNGARDMNSRALILPVFVLAFALAAPAWGSTSGGLGATTAPAPAAAQALSLIHI